MGMLIYIYMLEYLNHLHVLYKIFSTQPVSQVLSSQVTNISKTLPDLTVQLTLQYSLVSLF